MYRIIRKTSRSFSSAIRPKKADSKRLLNSSFTVRSIRNEDIPGIIELTRKNLFQYPASSLKLWPQQDPDGIQVAVHNASGEVLGFGANVKNSENLYFGGMFIVQERYRNSDIAKQIFKVCFDHRGNGNTGANVVLNIIDAVKKRGISILETDWKSLEYESYSPVNPDILSDELPIGVEVLPFQPSYLEAVLTYDRSIVGYERRFIIEASCSDEDGSKTLVAMKDGRCVGFGSIKLNLLELGRIGPLYADDPSVAEAMAKRLISALPEAKGFTIVTISSNILGNMMLEKLQIPVHDNIYRLYKRERLKVDTKKIFAHLDIDFSFF